jgi:hypothetical protein
MQPAASSQAAAKPIGAAALLRPGSQHAQTLSGRGAWSALRTVGRETTGRAAPGHTLLLMQPGSQIHEGGTKRCADHVHAARPRIEDLPAPFLAWLAENGIDPSVYALNSTLPRYVRRNPRLRHTQPSVAALATQLGVAAPEELRPVRWLPGGAHAWYALDCRLKIARCEAYRSGHIYGVDASSGAAALALRPELGDHVCRHRHRHRRPPARAHFRPPLPRAAPRTGAACPVYTAAADVHVAAILSPCVAPLRRCWTSAAPLA